jgi:hypothetical protein
MRQLVVAALWLAFIFPRSSWCVQPLSREDSLRVLRWAQHAQWDFERHRRFGLPSIYTNQSAPCDRIGRFCLRHKGVAFQRIPDEPLEQPRENLRHVLDSAATMLPGDDWIAGQRVRYRIDAGDAAAALAAARSCQGTSWWCAALEGMALHVTGDFPSAEAAFERALSQMPAEKRCSWTDLSYLLEESLRGAYRRLGCEERTDFNRAVWRMADPLFLTPGNERWTEHLARHVWAESERVAVNTFWLPWGPDLEEMIVRYGWSEKWTREPAAILEAGPPVVNGHAHEPNYHFFPEREPPEDLGGVDESLWDTGKLQPKEAYAPRYAQVFARLQPQVARFRRGDSTLVVAAYRREDYEYLAQHTFYGALAVVADDSTPPLVARSTESGGGAAMLAITLARTAMLSVETLARDSTVAARWRAVMTRLELRPEAALTISDLLFYEPPSTLATDVYEAAHTAYGNVLYRDKKVGLYWELYGQTSRDSVLAVSLTLSPITDNLFKRAIQALGIGYRPAPIKIRWRENGSAGFRSPRSLMIDISLIPPGTYEVTLQVGDREETVTQRVLEIR